MRNMLQEEGKKRMIVDNDEADKSPCDLTERHTICQTEKAVSLKEHPSASSLLWSDVLEEERLFLCSGDILDAAVEGFGLEIN